MTASGEQGSPEHEFKRELPPRPAAQRSQVLHVLRYWALEILTVLFAIFLLAAIIGLLDHYDGRYMPEWPFEINLNSAIAFLSTFLKAAIVAAVAEIIGQIKWNWFTERTRPLHHLQDFDAASRSVLGSTKLIFMVLWNWGFTSAGFIGLSSALVTIASLAVGPVTQQAIKTASCPLLNPTALSAIPAAHFVPGTSAYYRVGAGSYELVVDMKSTMIKGLTESTSDSSDVDIVCKTGNCTWPDYGTGVTHATIGLCRKCVDTTDFVSAPNEGGNLTLPDEDAYINFSSEDYMWVGYSNLSAYTALFDEDFLTAAAVSVKNFSILTSSTSPCTVTDNTTGTMTCPHKVDQDGYYDGYSDYIATSCVLYPCMKEYSATYENNILAETLIRETTAIPNTHETTLDDDSSASYTSSVFANYTAAQTPCVLDKGTWYDYTNQTAALHTANRTWANISLSSPLLGDLNVSVPNACLYKMDGAFASALAAFLSELFTGSCGYDSMQAGHLNCGESWWLTPLWGDMNATAASLDAAIHDFATVVTNKFRMTGTGPDQMQGGPRDPALVYGAVYETSTCTYFDRQWIALPAGLVTVCIGLLGWIFVKTYRDPEQPVWKGSVLPLMFFGLHGPPPSGKKGMRGGPVVEEEEEAAPEKDRLERNATFFRAGGRLAPELDRINGEAGRMYVRFHGGTDPGFVDLGAMGKRNDRRVDAEASVVALVPEHRREPGGKDGP